MDKENFIVSIRLDGEIWRDVKGYEGYYIVSSLGRIASLWKHIIMHPLTLRSKKCRYFSVLLHGNHIIERKLLHRLVAEAFLPNPHGYVEINHKDEDKTNNHIINLEWCDRDKNCNHGTRNKRISEYQSKPVVQISMTGEILNTFPSASEAEKTIGVRGGHIGSCCQGKRKTAHGYRWRYK